MKKTPIKSWAIDDRPREKFLLKGAKTLSNAELIAILIGSGNKNESAVELAKRMMQSVDNQISKLAQLSLNEMEKFKGIGSAKAISILTALELGLRREINPNNQLQIKSSSDAFQVFKSVLAYLNVEEFWVLYLNSSHKIIDKVQISKGGINSASVDVRVILKQALLCSSTSIILAHNHPSGNLKPSDSDILLTQKISDASELLNIKILDHLIIGNSDFFSFKDEGLI